MARQVDVVGVRRRRAVNESFVRRQLAINHDDFRAATARLAGQFVSSRRRRQDRLAWRLASIGPSAAGSRSSRAGRSRTGELEETRQRQQDGLRAQRGAASWRALVQARTRARRPFACLSGGPAGAGSNLIIWPPNSVSSGAEPGRVGARQGDPPVLAAPSQAPICAHAADEAAALGGGARRDKGQALLCCAARCGRVRGQIWFRRPAGPTVGLAVCCRLRAKKEPGSN